MAMMDYGAVVKINGKIVNENEFFMDMQKAVGWVDYPKVRYEDCDCLDEDGYADCSECPRRKMKHMSIEEVVAEFKETLGDFLPEDIDYKKQFRLISGTYFG